jgi:hypothetical protein
MKIRCHHSPFATLVTTAAALAIILLAPSPARAQNQSQPDQSSSKSDDGNISAGFNLGKDANAKDVGLPLYPGAHRHKDTNDDSSALNMGLWGGQSGFKMALIKMESTDAPEKIAAFYRKALARYGKVVTCPADGQNGAAPAEAKNPPPDSAGGLNCDSDQSDHHEKNEIELKAGTKEKQHVVGIKPEGNLTTFTLIYIETRGLEDKNK